MEKNFDRKQFSARKMLCIVRYLQTAEGVSTQKWKMFNRVKIR